MDIPVQKVRDDTHHCEETIHFNNAGASLPPRIVIESIHRQLKRDESLGGYEAQFGVAANELSEVYTSIADLVGGQAKEIAIFDGATRAWQSAIYAMDWQPGDRIITCEAEYPSNVYAYRYLFDKYRVETTYIPDDDSGQVDLALLKSAIDSRTKLITATHIPTYNGLINPVAEVGAIANAAHIPFLLDACQSVGHLHIDVNEIGCDFLSSAGRKFLRGPRGTGFLWIRESILDKLQPQIADNFSASWISPEQFELRPDARRFETFERSPALHLGLGAAAKYATTLGTRAIEDRNLSLAAELRSRLAALPSLRIHDRGKELSGIVTFSIPGVDSDKIVDFLRTRRINTSLVSAGHAMRSFPKRDIASVVRASVHYYNTSDELQAMCDALASYK